MPFSNPRNIFPQLSTKVPPEAQEEFLSLEQIQLVTRVDGKTSITALAMLLRRPVDELIADVKALMLLDVLEIYEHTPATGTFEHRSYSLDDEFFSEFSQTLLPVCDMPELVESNSSLPEALACAETVVEGASSNTSEEADDLVVTWLASDHSVLGESEVGPEVTVGRFLEESRSMPESEVVTTYSGYSIAAMDFVPEPEPLSRSTEQLPQVPPTQRGSSYPGRKSNQTSERRQISKLSIPDLSALGIEFPSEQEMANTVYEVPSLASMRAYMETEAEDLPFNKSSTYAQAESACDIEIEVVVESEQCAMEVATSPPSSSQVLPSVTTPAPGKQASSVHDQSRLDGLGNAVRDSLRRQAHPSQERKVCATRQVSLVPNSLSYQHVSELLGEDLFSADSLAAVSLQKERRREPETTSSGSYPAASNTRPDPEHKL